LRKRKALTTRILSIKTHGLKIVEMAEIVVIIKTLGAAAIAAIRIAAAIVAIIAATRIAAPIMDIVQCQAEADIRVIRDIQVTLVILPHRIRVRIRSNNHFLMEVINEAASRALRMASTSSVIAEHRTAFGTEVFCSTNTAGQKFKILKVT
jgi:hypothetical protein